MHKGFLKAGRAPTLFVEGANMRMWLGVLVDRYRPKQIGIGTQIAVIASLIVARFAGIHRFGGKTLLLGCVLGLAGASFAVGLPLASA
jgi:NNP family nitrate/nitrite transporter-like MFS transporter